MLKKNNINKDALFKFSPKDDIDAYEVKSSGDRRCLDVKIDLTK